MDNSVQNSGKCTGSLLKLATSIIIFKMSIDIFRKTSSFYWFGWFVVNSLEE